MVKTSEFVEFVLERISESGIDILSLRSRAMFGGFGIYYDDVMFSLVADDELYLKTGESNEQMFESAGLPRFSYERSGKRFDMSYSLAPESIYDEPEEMARWIKPAIDAALAADRKKRKKNRS